MQLAMTRSIPNVAARFLFWSSSSAKTVNTAATSVFKISVYATSRTGVQRKRRKKGKISSGWPERRSVTGMAAKLVCLFMVTS